MTDHIKLATSVADTMAATDVRPAAYTNVLLEGILRALLALHEQAEPKSTTRAPRTPKESK